jgi:hypothetical protein
MRQAGPAAVSTPRALTLAYVEPQASSVRLWLLGTVLDLISQSGKTCRATTEAVSP